MDIVSSASQFDMLTAHMKALCSSTDPKMSCLVF